MDKNLQVRRSLLLVPSGCAFEGFLGCRRWRKCRGTIPVAGRAFPEHRFVTKRKNKVRSASLGQNRKRFRCYRCQQIGQLARECLFMPGDAFAQLLNLGTYMCSAFLTRTSRSKHSDFVGLILEPARDLTDSGIQQLVVGTSVAQR